MRITEIISENDDDKKRNRTKSNHGFIKKFSREKYNMPEPLDIVDDPGEYRSLRKQYDDLQIDPGNDPSDIIDQKDLKKVLSNALLKLPARYERVARLRFLNNIPRDKVASEFGITSSRLLQIENKILRLLLSNPNIQQLGQDSNYNRANAWANRKNWSVDDYIKYYGEKPSARWISVRGLDKDWSIDDYIKYYGERPDFWWIRDRGLDKDWSIDDFKKTIGYLPDSAWIKKHGLDKGWTSDTWRKYQEKSLRDSRARWRHFNTPRS